MRIDKHNLDDEFGFEDWVNFEKYISIQKTQWDAAGERVTGGWARCGWWVFNLCFRKQKERGTIRSTEIYRTRFIEFLNISFNPIEGSRRNSEAYPGAAPPFDWLVAVTIDVQITPNK